MINRVVLVGRLTKDPVLRYTPSGVANATFTLAVNRTFTNQNGEKQADFLNVVVWRKQAENVSKYLLKGSLTGVEGRLQSRKYEDQTGRTVYVTEVVADSVQFLESKNSRNNNQQQSDYQPRDNGGFNDDPFAGDGQPIDISDDDLPF